MNDYLAFFLVWVIITLVKTYVIRKTTSLGFIQTLFISFAMTPFEAAGFVLAVGVAVLNFCCILVLMLGGVDIDQFKHELEAAAKSMDDE
jgi:hypothetical protein